jgi:large subunit ribosomal protein L22
MEIVATQKYIIMSPTKIRPVVNMIKSMKPQEAIDVLPHTRKGAANPLRKVILTAVSNAKERGLEEQNLVFKEIQIGEGPRLKRGRPVSKGRWHPYKKRMSHIRVVLIEKEDSKKKKTEKTEKVEKEVKKSTKKENDVEKKNSKTKKKGNK